MINKAHSQSDFEILQSAISQKQWKMVNKAHSQSDFEIFILAISQKERNHRVICCMLIKNEGR